MGTTKEGGEISGTVDLLACGPFGCMLIDHKTGGPGDGLGSYWPQLSAYGNLVSTLMPEKPATGLGIFWIDHGRLDLAVEVELPSMGGFT